MTTQELNALADACPELNMRNYTEADVDELNNWAIEVAAAITRTAATSQASVNAMREALERVVKFDECRTPEPMLREMVVSYYSNHLLDQAFAYHCADRFIAALTASEGNAAPGASTAAVLEHLAEARRLFGKIRGDFLDPRDWCDEGREVIDKAVAALSPATSSNATT